MLTVIREMISVQFTITSMHFDNYLQTKTTQPPQFSYNKFHYPTAQNNTQNNSFRHSTTSHHLPFNKATLSYLQTRQESSKSTVSSNFLTNDLKNVNLEYKPMNPIPAQIKPQVTVNHNFISIASNGQKIHEQKKFINLSPAKPTGRMTTGLAPQQIQKIQPRRSESVNDPRIKDTAENFNAPWFRQNGGATGSSKNTTNLSPFQLNFNNIRVFSDKNNSFYDGKQSAQNMNYFKTNNNQWSASSNLLYTNRGSHHEQAKLEKSFVDLQKEKKIDQIIADSNLTSNNATLNESLYKQPSLILSRTETGAMLPANKEDRIKNISNKSISYIQKDIEKLKNASKRVDQVYHSQISRNYYFNKFLEEKGIKSPEQDKKFELKETKDSKELEKRVSYLQQELQQKRNEIIDKGRELMDQTKTILDKNKVIDSLSIQQKQYKARLQNKQNELKDKERQMLELKDKYDQMIILRRNQQIFYQRIVQYNKKQQTEKLLFQKLRKENEKIKQQFRNIEQINKKLTVKITKYEQTIGEVQEINKQYLAELNETRQKLRTKETQLIIYQASLQNQKEIVKQQQNTIQQLKNQQLKNRQNASCQHILSSQQANKPLQSMNYEQQIIKLTHKINDLQQKSMELSILLLNNKVYNHETVVLKVIQIKQSIKIAQTLRQRQQQRAQEFHLLRVHQEYVQKKLNELSRQCKKISAKLGAVTNQAQLGWKMLNETNNEVVLLNLKRLNENYNQKAEQIQ